jgi:hypothetical protein
MEAREIYAALFDARGPVGAPSGEWNFIGDNGCFEPERLNRIIVAAIGNPRAYVAVSRKTAAEMPIGEVADAVRNFMQQGTVRIADVGLTQFMEVNPMGVARSWSHDA